MKKTALTALSVLATLAASTYVHAQSKDNLSPSLLYQVSGKGLAKPSYIFGTFHAICSTEMVPISKLDIYLTEADQLMMEVDLDDPAVMQAMGKSIYMPAGKTLKDLLTAEELAKVDEMLKAYLGAPVESVMNLKPSMLTVLTLTRPKALGCTAVGFDVDLMKSAVEKKKPVVGLETVESQVKVLDSMPLDKQARALYKVASDTPKAITELKKLMDVYKAQDVEKLFDVTANQASEDKEFHARLLDERNISWIPKLELAFKEKPTFVAVGAGHLGGKKGVLHLLKQKGYVVRPVKL